MSGFFHTIFSVFNSSSRATQSQSTLNCKPLIVKVVCQKYAKKVEQAVAPIATLKKKIRA